MKGHSQALAPSELSETQFVERFADVYEESPWVARIVWWECDGATLDDVTGLMGALRVVVDRAPEDIQLALLRAHPDLAGRAARAGALSDASNREQAGAGLDQCTDEEYRSFQDLNIAYRDKFHFPFIIAVGGLERPQILKLFRLRLDNSRRSEFETAIAEVHKIATLRLQEMLVERHA